MPDKYDDEKVVNIYHGYFIQWFGKMLKCVESLPLAERAEFEKWDGERPIGVKTSDWPGFAKYLPPPPWKSFPR